MSAVMVQSASLAPAGLRYSASVMEDSVTFVHVSSHSGEARWTDLTAFQAFLADHASRCEEGPVRAR
jgi:hypothetical protein